MTQRRHSVAKLRHLKSMKSHEIKRKPMQICENLNKREAMEICEKPGKLRMCLSIHENLYGTRHHQIIEEVGTRCGSLLIN